MSPSSPNGRPTDDDLFDVSHLDTELSRRATFGGTLVLSAQLLKIVLFFGVTAILARLVPPAEFGHVALILPVFFFIVDVSRNSLGSVVMQRSEIGHDEVSGLFWINLLIGGALALLFCLSSPFFVAFYNNSQVVLIMLALAAPMFVAPIGTLYEAILGRQMNYRAIVLASLGSEILAAILAVIAALSGWSYWAFVVQIVARFCGNLVFVMLATKWRPAGPRVWRKAVHLMKFGGDLAAYFVLQEGTSALGTVIVGRTLGPTAAGIYFRAWNVSMWPMTRVIGPLRGVIASALARAMDDDVRAKRALFRTVTLAAMISVPLAAFFSTCADGIVLLLLGPAWIETASVLSWFGLILLAAPIMSTLESFVTMTGNTRSLLRYGVFGAIVSILGYVIGIQFGMVGLAISYSITQVALALPVLMIVSARALSGPWFATLRGLLGAVVPFFIEAGFIVLVVLEVRGQMSEHLSSWPAIVDLAGTGAFVAVLHLAFCLALRSSRDELKKMAGLAQLGIRKTLGVG